MPMYPPTYRKQGVCKKCGTIFLRKAANQVFCPDCSYWKHFEGGAIRGRLVLAEPRLKRLADESGNPKIWRRGNPVDALPEGMKKRIEMAFRFGV